MLSVSGARGIVGESMTEDVARRFARAFAEHVRAGSHRTAGAPLPRMVLGNDGRGSGSALAVAAADGLQECGFDVIDIGTVATPTVGLMIGQLQAVGGIAVTASHNPVQWNGLKTLNADGLALPAAEAAKVIAAFRANVPQTAAPQRGLRSLHSNADETHVERVLSLVDVDRIRAAQFRVVLDSVNGGGARSGGLLLRQLGCDLLHLNAERTGSFAHTPEPIAENLGDLCDAVHRDGRAVVGFAQDPDADRLAMVDGAGRYIGEEYTLVLCALRMLQRHGQGALATNLSTSRMIDDVAARFPNSRVWRTAVGEANVVGGLRAHDGIIGGEGNGGLIWPRVCWVRDSLSAMALTLELLAHERTSIGKIVEGLPKYAMIKRKMDLAAVGGQTAVASALDRVRAHFGARADARIDDADGVRIDLPAGWVHLRASNTEPIIRLIAEAASASGAEGLAQECATVAGLSAGG